MRFVRVLTQAGLLLACATCVASSPWTTQDYVLEGLTVTSLAVDWRQTSEIHKDCYQSGDTIHVRTEENTLLGKHPQQSTINQYFLTSAFIHAVIADQLSGKWRMAWQMAWIGVEVGTVERNYKLGIRLNF